MLEVGSPIISDFERSTDRECSVTLVLDGGVFVFAHAANQDVTPNLQGHRIHTVETAQAPHLSSSPLMASSI